MNEAQHASVVMEERAPLLFGSSGDQDSHLDGATASDASRVLRQRLGTNKPSLRQGTTAVMVLCRPPSGREAGRGPALGHDESVGQQACFWVSLGDLAESIYPAPAQGHTEASSGGMDVNNSTPLCV